MSTRTVTVEYDPSALLARTEESGWTWEASLQVILTVDGEDQEPLLLSNSGNAFSKGGAKKGAVAALSEMKTYVDDLAAQLRTGEEIVL